MSLDRARLTVYSGMLLTTCGMTMVTINSTVTAMICAPRDVTNGLDHVTRWLKQHSPDHDFMFTRTGIMGCFPLSEKDVDLFVQHGNGLIMRDTKAVMTTPFHEVT